MLKKSSIRPSSKELPLRNLSWSIPWFFRQAWNWECCYCQPWSVWKIRPFKAECLCQACLSMSMVCLGYVCGRWAGNHFLRIAINNWWQVSLMTIELEFGYVWIPLMLRVDRTKITFDQVGLNWTLGAAIAVILVPALWLTNKLWLVKPKSSATDRQFPD